MTVTAVSRPAAHTWIAGAALAWNLLGLLMFFLQVFISPAQVAALSPPDRAIHDATPAWINAAFAVAVGGGVLGSLGLLLRQRWAVACLAASLVAILVQCGGTYLVTPMWEAYGVAGLLMPVLLVIVAVLLLRYARRVTA